jgi:deoxyribodipyrimidine photolyase-like uncharacterized protein
MPEASFVSVIAEDGSASHFSLLRDSAHSNVAELFHEEKRRLEPEDTLTAVPGFLGAHPNALFEVKRRELDEFVAAVEALRSASDYRALRERFGVLRGSERFWPHSDRIHRDHEERRGLESGLFDYNRLEGY